MTVVVVVVVVVIVIAIRAVHVGLGGWAVCHRLSEGWIMVVALSYHRRRAFAHWPASTAQALQVGSALPTVRPGNDCAMPRDPLAVGCRGARVLPQKVSAGPAERRGSGRRWEGS
jgi:hypothetical protein